MLQGEAAVGGIVTKGFNPSTGGKLGAGVYVSPHLEYAQGSKDIYRYLNASMDEWSSEWKDACIEYDMYIESQHRYLDGRKDR